MYCLCIPPCTEVKKLLRTVLFGPLYIFLLIPSLIFTAVGHLAVENVTPAMSKCFILFFLCRILFWNQYMHVQQKVVEVDHHLDCLLEAYFWLCECNFSDNVKERIRCQWWQIVFEISYKVWKGMDSSAIVKHYVAC